ncbi:FecR family protein [Sphingobium aquiterrae]|uniref:FecR family protein n=1 Tax=Sphingobium aquiterrae TaxID=2038656 RepID=UPI0030188C1F
MSRRLDEVEDAAAAWDARLRGAKATFRDRRAFQAWLQEDAEHQAAHDRLQAALSMLRAHAKLPELSALRDEARNSVHQSRRRRVASAIALAVAAMLLLMLVVAPQTERGAEIAALLHGDTVYATSPDERIRVTLADGSVATLDSSTRLLVRLGKARRDITLLSGRALFQVAKDRQRPFVVRAGDRTITALGTVFDVRLSPRELRVTLAEGRVAVRPVQPRQGSAEQILKPRQQLVEIAGMASPELRTVDTDKALSWADGQVFFENEPLASAVEEMNQYSHLKIVVDPAVADLRINGMFRTGNQAGFIAVLQIALPVEVRNDDQGRIFVSRRPEPVAE